VNSIETKRTQDINTGNLNNDMTGIENLQDKSLADREVKSQSDLTI